jgi:DNA polymerase
LHRGQIPCDILFVGEAPGASEDLLGQPFVGPAGKVLDNILADLRQYFDYTFCITNIVCCLPMTPHEGLREPFPDEAGTCFPHVLRLIIHTSPKLIVALGQFSSGILKAYEIKHQHVVHPAAILRMDTHRQRSSYVHAVQAIRRAYEETCDANN